MPHESITIERPNAKIYVSYEGIEIEIHGKSRWMNWDKFIEVYGKKLEFMAHIKNLFADYRNNEDDLSL